MSEVESMQGLPGLDQMMMSEGLGGSSLEATSPTGSIEPITVTPAQISTENQNAVRAQGYDAGDVARAAEIAGRANGEGRVMTNNDKEEGQHNQVTTEENNVIGNDEKDLPSLGELLSRPNREISSKDLESFRKAGIIETPDSMQSRDEARRNVEEVTRILESDGPLSQDDAVKINEAFRYVDERKDFLTKRDNALGMGKVIGKYDDILSPQTGAAFDMLTPEERQVTAAINRKATRVAVILDEGYDNSNVNPSLLKKGRDEIKVMLYKNGKKLGETGSMLPLDQIDVPERRKELAKKLQDFKAEEAIVTNVQNRAVGEYVQPRNRITKKEMAVLNDTCALGLLRLERKAAENDMDRLKRKLGRGDLVVNALVFVERRVGRFEWVKEAIKGASMAVNTKRQETKGEYEAASDRLTNLTGEAGEKRQKELRAQMRTYGTERATRLQREARDIGVETKSDLESTLKNIKDKAESNLKKILGSSTTGFLAAFAILALSNVCAGAGIPVEMVVILSASLGAAKGLAERGYSAFKSWREARKAMNDAREINQATMPIMTGARGVGAAL